MTGRMNSQELFMSSIARQEGFWGDLDLAVLYIGSLNHVFSPCLNSRYQCNHIATDLSFSDSSFFKLLPQIGYLCFSGASALRRISEQFLQYHLHSL